MRRYAPTSAAVLAPGAAPEAITAAQAELGLTFPAELVESLQRHDGLTEWANVLPEAAPLSVAGIVEQRRTRMEVADSVGGFVPSGPGMEPWWHELWLPFADAEGDLQVIDLRPGPTFAQVGLAPHDNPGDFSEPWSSLGAYLTAVAAALETGSAAGGWYPYLTVDSELWWSLAGETHLNGEPLRPVPGAPS